MYVVFFVEKPNLTISTTVKNPQKVVVVVVVEEVFSISYKSRKNVAGAVKDLPTKMGILAVLIPIKDRRQFDPPYDLVAIDVAMREYSM